MSFAALLKGYRFPPGQEDEAEPAAGRPHSEERQITRLRVAALTFAFAVVGTVAFLFGFSVGTAPASSLATDVGVRFEYQRQYSDPPSPASNRAWLGNFPRSHGFVKPPGAEGLSILSVFHQLHCINVLRHGYYVATNASYLEQTLQDISISRESVKHEHVVHCFDYLRQATLCFSDRTPEPVDFARGGALGWGSVHQCRNHNETLELARAWAMHRDDEDSRHD